ncbi:MAG: hypothetical protein ACLUI3_02630 [Christensenellales bacterium]
MGAQGKMIGISPHKQRLSANEHLKKQYLSIWEYGALPIPSKGFQSPFETFEPKILSLFQISVLLA